MKTRHALLQLAGPALLLAGAFAVPGCAGADPGDGAGAPEASFSAVPSGLPGDAVLVDDFVVHLLPAEGRILVERAPRPGNTGARGPALHPESIDSLSILQDNVAGSGPASTVELVTEVNGATGNTIDYNASCPGYTGAGIFCANVTLRHFYPRELSNTYVQITAITDAATGQPIANHAATNSDGAPSWPGYTVDGSKGLWKYTATGAAPGVLGLAPDNAALRTWVFANPDNAATNVQLRVFSTLSYKDYGRFVSTATFIDACTLAGAAVSTSAGNVLATMPFPFTFYNVQATTKVKYNRDGVIAFNGADPPSSANSPFKSVTLPESPASVSVSPAAYFFWDALDYNPTGSLCSGTSGAAPGRKFVITWKNMKIFGSASNAQNLTFSAILSEGIDRVEVVYSSMVGSGSTNQARADGGNAVTGVEGPGTGGTTNISTPFPSKAGGTSTATGKKYLYSPIP